LQRPTNSIEAREPDQEELRMINQRAENSFREGRQLLDAGRPRDALTFFKSAMTLDELECEQGHGQARYRSYYGLCLCLTRNGMRDALLHCRKATETENFSPDLWWNLGRVALAVRHNGEAYRAFEQGLRCESNHLGILRDIKRLGIRRPPTLSFLPRGHALNVVLGRLRAKLQPADRPVVAPAPGATTGVRYRESSLPVSPVSPLAGR
jgi:tetratricopeptide (TPR) repeat protein